MLVIAVIPAVLKAFVGGNAIGWVADRIDVSYLAIIFSVISIVLKAGEEKKALTSVPWNTLFMVSGMGMLIEVASSAGALKYLSDYISGSFSPEAVPYAMGIVGNVMSFFASTMGVVIPTLYPIIHGVCTASDALPGLTFAVVAIASTSLSPFSLSGGLGMGAAPEEKKNSLFWSLIICSVLYLVLVMACVAVGIISN
jgi:di/tricarboxylate transporter